MSLCFGYIGVSGHRREKQSVLGLDIFSAKYWVTIFKFEIKSLIRELRNCMSNRSAIVIVLFDSSSFGTC